MSGERVAALTEDAATRNLDVGVTGLLFCASGRFIQLIEGDAEAVGALYRRIAADPRHAQVTKVLDAPIDGRAFAGWSMRLVTEDELTRAERALVTDALRSIDPAEPSDRGVAWTLRDLLDDELGSMMKSALPPPPLPAGTLEMFDRMLIAAEAIMAQRGVRYTLTLDDVAREADVSETVARRHFRTIDDLLAVGVRRVLVIEYANFLAFMRRHAFQSREEIAAAIVEFIIQRHADRMGVSPLLRRRIVRGHGELARDAAARVGALLEMSPPLAGWPCPHIGSDAIGASLAATESVAQAMTRDDESALADPDAPALLFNVSFAALDRRCAASGLQ